MFKYLIQMTFGAAAILLLQNCQTNTDPIVQSKDYEDPLTEFAQFSGNDQKDLAFWDSKLLAAPEQFPYMAKLAAAYEKTFYNTGNIEALNTSAVWWQKTNEAAAYSSAAYMRQAAKNAITRHEFKLAYDLLKKAEKNGEKLRATQLMLFDAALELGSFKEAQRYLNLTKDFSDVNYLIRLAKWEDFQGNLSKTIMHMQDILRIAKENNNQSLILWTVTNLGDYYGHDGNIKRSYNSYLEALSIDPANKYAKKGIAYIAYAHDNNPEEALRIMKTNTGDNVQPDDLLFMAQLAESKGDVVLKDAFLNGFSNLLTNKNYGELYNIPQAQIWLERGQHNDAIDLLTHEVKRRKTPETYGALAMAYYKSGDTLAAYQIVKAHVQNKTFEPSLLLIEAQILKSMGKELQRVKELKKELQEATYELGPKSIASIEAL